MGRPKGSQNKSTSGANKAKKAGTPTRRKLCSICGAERGDLPVTQFYRSYNKIHGDGYIPICKKCLKDLCFDEAVQDVDFDEFKSILRQVDKPYISNVFRAAVNQYNDTYGGKRVPKNNRDKIISYYFKNINSLRQYTTMSWMDGIEWEKACEQQMIEGKAGDIMPENYTMPESKNSCSASQKQEERIYSVGDDDDFDVTQDVIRLFGSGYKKSEYKAMWDKYDFLRKNYPDVTNLHTEALVTYVRFKTQEEMATARGDADEAKTWSDAAMKAADKAKINPSQLSQSDLQGGLNSFSELLQATEKAVDIIPILPRFKYRPNDAVDFIILCLVNYIRDLEGKPLCEYKDVYSFYDKRKAEYIEQYGDPDGIFTDDPTEKNRTTVEKFIDVPALER